MTEFSATLQYIPIEENSPGPILVTMSQNIPNHLGKLSSLTYIFRCLKKLTFQKNLTVKLENLSFDLLQKRETFALSGSLTNSIDLVGK